MFRKQRTKAVIRNMSDRSRTENNRNEDSKEEKLFRAMAGVDEDLLLRSEQSGSGNSKKVYKFPTHYVTRIAAACLCFVVAGVMYVTMSGTKMADSTGSAEMAAPQLANSITADTAMPEENEAARAEQYAAARTEEAGKGAGMDGEAVSGTAMSESAIPEAEGELPESAVTENASELSGGVMAEAADNEMQEAQEDSGTPEKQDIQMSAAGADSCCDGGMAESSTEATTQKEEVIEKQGRHLPDKMTRKGQ